MLAGADEGRLRMIAELVNVLGGRGTFPKKLEPCLKLLREEYVLV